MTEWNWNGWWDQRFAIAWRLDPCLLGGLARPGSCMRSCRKVTWWTWRRNPMLIGDGCENPTPCGGDRSGETRRRFMLPSGQVTMLYSKHHGKSAGYRSTLRTCPRYDQPYRMAGIGPRASALPISMVLATRDEDTLYLHAINRHFEQTLGAAGRPLQPRPTPRQAGNASRAGGPD